VDRFTGLLILSVNNPAGPTLLGSYDTPHGVFDVVVSKAVAYLADHSGGLEILNVANPASPALLGTYDTPGWNNHGPGSTSCGSKREAPARSGGWW
jgi:hypothetical protein